MKKELYLGVMSGTSLDGVDVVLMDFSTEQPSLVAVGFTPMPEDLRKSLTQMCADEVVSLRTLGEIDHRLGHLYANAINDLLAENDVDPSDIQGVGCHGQTIWHSPEGQYPFTMQIGDANIIAAKTKVTTVADFRRKDMAYGGQGAPLVPAFHESLFSHPDHLTVVLNIGGVSNISVLALGESPLGYDTGPGNLLLDFWIERHTGERYDRDAEWALTGTVHAGLLKHLMDEPYFAQPAPKSTGRELFGAKWLNEKLNNYKVISPADVQATLVELSAQSIYQELVHHSKRNFDSKPQVLLVCGGGAKNPLLMSRLSALAHDWTVTTTSENGLDVDYVEAAAFAWLARERLNNRPGNVPAVTGASCPVSLGAIYPAEITINSGK